MPKQTFSAGAESGDVFARQTAFHEDSSQDSRPITL
jgi:hypothetical protein